MQHNIMAKHSEANMRKVLFGQWMHSAVVINAIYIKKEVRYSASTTRVSAEMLRVLALPSTSEINRSPFMAISHAFAKCKIFINQNYKCIFYFHDIYLIYHFREKSFPVQIDVSRAYEVFQIIWLNPIQEGWKGEERKLYTWKRMEENNSNQEERC